MNRVVVLRAAAGLAAYLIDQGAAKGSSVVIGYDARRNSDVFARDTAEVMTGAGLKAWCCRGRCRPRSWRSRSASSGASPA